MVNRAKVSLGDKAIAESEFKEALEDKIKEKGAGIFVSTHEGFGVITEEYNEFSRAIESNNPEQIKKELLDILIAGFWLLASMETGEMDW